MGEGIRVIQAGDQASAIRMGADHRPRWQAVHGKPLRPRLDTGIHDAKAGIQGREA